MSRTDETPREGLLLGRGSSSGMPPGYPNPSHKAVPHALTDERIDAIIEELAEVKKAATEGRFFARIAVFITPFIFAALGAVFTRFWSMTEDFAVLQDRADTAQVGVTRDLDSIGDSQRSLAVSLGLLHTEVGALREGVDTLKIAVRDLSTIHRQR